MSPFGPSFSPQSKVYPQPFDSCNPRAPKSPFVFNRLCTLYLSCRSFCDSRPLFSITSALFDKNTGGRVSRSGLWTLGGSRRRLRVPETKLRDTRGGIPSRDLLFPCENETAGPRYGRPAACAARFLFFIVVVDWDSGLALADGPLLALPRPSLLPPALTACISGR